VKINSCVSCYAHSQGIVEQITINNLPIGRSVDEAKRLLQAIQFVKEHGEVSIGKLVEVIQFVLA
jgi:hypothetical protein